MRCCVCVSDCRTFTTNLRKDEELKHEKEMDFHSSAGNAGDAALCGHRRRGCAAIVELVAAAVVRLAPDYLLASAWNSGAVPAPLRRIPWPWRRTHMARAAPDARTHGAAHGRALGAHDPGRAGTIPPKDALAVRLRSDHPGEQTERFVT